MSFVDWVASGRPRGKDAGMRPYAVHMDATEDAASRRPAPPGDTRFILKRPLRRRLGARPADRLDEVAAGRVEVEDACRAAGAAEPVPCTGRGGDERTWAEDDGVLACSELDLAVEHEERVGMVGMRMRLDDEGLVEVDLDHRDLCGVDANEAVAVVPLMALALSGVADDGIGHPGSL